MNNDIKEILDNLKDENSYEEGDLVGIKWIELKQEETNLLLDYITNLQEENERLKEENKHIFSKVNDDELLISNAMNYAEAQDYKSRIDKAIEYIERCRNYHRDIHKEEKIFPDEITSLLMILQGEDKDVKDKR